MYEIKVNTKPVQFIDNFSPPLLVLAELLRMSQGQ